MAYRIKVVELDRLPPAPQILTARETKTYEEFKVEKRRREWLGGRYALKQLAMDFFTFDMLHMEVRSTPSGKPVLMVQGGTHLPVSITHSGDYAAAAIGLTGDNIGIDIELIENRGKEWARMCFHKDEISSSAAFFLTELWAKKEAVLKFLGTGLSLDMKDVRFIGGRLMLYGKALDVWAQTGSPNIQVDASDLDGGYKLAVAAEAPHI
ncbi:MAG: 4'-phosphopantetheinyl transferase superfamily protein [Elusimicrobiota bacterium]|jgi:4'-phosphopantetheinyl transferase|nr:4'-phosphopantetheinyl transferase superfamily protein [Elusimicrobiota bacterium]